MNRVTVRALRHYAEIGLMRPEIIDRSSGYRYYSVGQLQKMQTIVHLKQVGFSLEEIRDLYEDDTHIPSISTLEDKILDCESELVVLKARHAQLKAMMASQLKFSKMQKFYYDRLPAIIVASHRTIIPSYDDLGPLCCEVIGPEMARLGCECPEPGYCFSFEHGGYKPHDIDIEYCEKVTAKGKDSEIIKFKELSEVPKAACMKVIGPYSQFYQSYQELFEHIEAEGLRIVGDPRCCYVDGIWNQEDPQKWLSIIQIPVE